MTTLEERVYRLERHHRRRWLRRAIKLGLLVALALLLLWLLRDWLTMLDGLQRQVTENSNVIHGLQTEVSSLTNKVNDVVVKINGQTVRTMPTLHPLSSGVFGGLFAVISRLLTFAVA